MCIKREIFGRMSSSRGVERASPGTDTHVNDKWLFLMLHLQFPIFFHNVGSCIYRIKNTDELILLNQVIESQEMVTTLTKTKQYNKNNLK